MPFNPLVFQKSHKGIAMNQTPNSDDRYSEEKTKRIMSRVALRKMSEMVSAWRAEEAENARLVKAILLVFLSVFLFLCFYWGVFFAPGPMRTPLITVLAIVYVVFMFITWVKRRR